MIEWFISFLYRYKKNEKEGGLVPSVVQEPPPRCIGDPLFISKPIFMSAKRRRKQWNQETIDFVRKMEMRKPTSWAKHSL